MAIAMQESDEIAVQRDCFGLAVDFMEDDVVLQLASSSMTVDEVRVADAVVTVAISKFARITFL